MRARASLDPSKKQKLVKSADVTPHPRRDADSQRISDTSPPSPRVTCVCCCASLVCALLCAVAYEHAGRASETLPETGSALLRGSSLHYVDLLFFVWSWLVRRRPPTCLCLGAVAPATLRCFLRRAVRSIISKTNSKTRQPIPNQINQI
jgi:hypothetical protein